MCCDHGVPLHQAELLMSLNKGLGLGGAACGTCRARGGNDSKGQAKGVLKRHRNEFVWGVRTSGWKAVAKGVDFPSREEDFLSRNGFWNETEITI